MHGGDVDPPPIGRDLEAVVANPLHAPDCRRYGPRMPARRLLAPAAALALLAGTGEAAAATVHTIRTNGDGWITRIGPLRTRAQAQPTIAKASAAFGRPTSVNPVGQGGLGCRVLWRGLRLRATFSSFGGADACDAGFLQVATIRSRRFRTRRNLRVGDRSSTIKQKHPDAVFRNKVWWIASAHSPYAGQRIPTIEAIVQGGRVRVLRLWIGAAGD